jgi:hypothetical protein
MPIDHVFHQGRDCAIALCDDVFIQIWTGPAHHDVLQMVATSLKSLKLDAFKARKLFVLHIVAETASPPDSEGRKIAAKFLPHIHHHVNVTEGTGFRASLIRSVIVGIALLASLRANYEVTASLSAGLDALAKAGCHASRTDLQAAVTELRAKLDPH